MPARHCACPKPCRSPPSRWQIHRPPRGRRPRLGSRWRLSRRTGPFEPSCASLMAGGCIFHITWGNWGSLQWSFRCSTTLAGHAPAMPCRQWPCLTGLLNQHFVHSIRTLHTQHTLSFDHSSSHFTSQASQGRAGPAQPAGGQLPRPGAAGQGRGGPAARPGRPAGAGCCWLGGPSYDWGLQLRQRAPLQTLPEAWHTAGPRLPSECSAVCLLLCCSPRIIHPYIFGTLRLAGA